LQFLRNKIQEVEKLKGIQLKNIESGFEELIRRLEERKKQLRSDFT